MTFLQYVSKFGKKATIALMILSCLTVASFSQKVGQQSQGKDYSKPGFVGEPINLNVVNADIRDILNYVTEQYGVNFVIDKSVQKVPITVNINDVPWNIALDAILRSQELGVQANGPILRIAASKTIADEGAVLEKQRDNQLDAAPLYTEIIRLNYAQATQSTSETGFTTGTANGESTGKSSGGDGLMPIIQRRVSRRGSIETDSSSNSLIITDVKENIEAIKQLVAFLDRPEPQIEVEARVVIATRDFSRDIGVQFSGLVVGNKLGQGGGVYGATTPTNKGDGVPEPFKGFDSNSQLKSGLANSVLGLTTGLIGTAQLNMYITAGEKKGQAKTIATPRVTILNNRKGIIESGQQIPIVTTQTGAGGASGGSGGGVVFTTTYVPVPLKLEVTPRVTNNGEVLLDVVVENSSLSSVVSAGGTPGINTQRTKVVVRVPDGGTTVMGGALIDVEGNDVFGVPGLSKIPVVGNLFRRKAVSRTTSEVLFFITPRISKLEELKSADPADVQKSSMILQPVPLGNPPSNSGGRSSENTQQPVTMPVVVPATGNPTKP